MIVDKTVSQLIENRIFPGISILAAQRDRVVFVKEYGYKSVSPRMERLTENTLYDLSSLTKPLVTAFLVVYLVEKEGLDLHTKVTSLFPELKIEATLLQLLTHTSGLPGWFPFYLFSRNYLNVFRKIQPLNMPGKDVTYSCVNYILLYYIIQKICGCPYEDFARNTLFSPLRLSHTKFRIESEEKNMVAPTEMGNSYEREMAAREYRSRSNSFPWREYMIRGETHDANSFYLGGTAGNSGLFSTTGDLFKILPEFLPGSCTLLKPETVKMFWKNQTSGANSHRTIGFVRNSGGLTSAGRVLSGKAIGHTGFTGTSIWLEPETENKFILLTNRVHPIYRNINFNRVRRKLHKILRQLLNS